MKIKIAKNKYFNAFLILMLLSAIVHMVILFVAAIWFDDLYLLNYFNILDLDLFFVNISNNITSNVLSILAMAVIYCMILKINDKDEV